MMKKIVIVALLASGLVACAQPQAPKEDSRLKEAYSACINTAEGSPEKIEACQSVLNVLKKEAHEQFATQENVRVMDYQACIQARKTGNDQEVAKRCDQIWKEIRSNNTIISCLDAR
jgi:predicted small secreted protein